MNESKGKSPDKKEAKKEKNGDKESCSSKSFAFRPSKLSSFGEKIEKSWKAEEKPPQSKLESLEEVLVHGSSNKVSPSKSLEEEKTDTSFKATDENNGFIFGSKIRERVESSEAKTEGAEKNIDSQTTFKKEAEKAKETSLGKDTASTSFKSAPTTTSEQLLQPAAVSITTGEEDESNLFQGSCKLHVFDSEAKKFLERGRGILRINRKQTETRLVMRVQGSLRVVLNSKLWSEMLQERLGPKRLKISATNPDSGEVQIYLLTTNSSDSTQIESLIERGIEILNNSDSRKRKLVDSESAPSSKSSC